MDLVLFALTGVSAAAAALFAVVAWRLVREERRRSAARVASLSSAIDGPTMLPDDVEPGSYLRIDVPAEMFAVESGASIKGRPMLKAAVVAVMAIVIIVAAAMGNRDHAAAPVAAAAPQQAPLELMSMRHQRDGTTLKVTGLVRNPDAGSEARGVAAVVFVFDRNGSFVASGRAPLDFVVLEPGGESPFVVSVPNVSDVARYRVSFRTDNGVVRHVDRRAELLQLAGN
jgi:hypothetical protein